MALSTLTVNNVPVMLRALLASRGADVSNLRTNRVLALVDSALETMAYRIARGEDYRGLQKQFSALSPVAGVLSRTTIGTTAIFDMARSTVREDSTGTLLTPVDSLMAFTYGELPLGQVYYAQDGDRLRFRDAAGSLTAFTSAVTITANYIPTLAQVPVEYHGLFLDTLAGLMTEPRPEIRAQELSEVGRA